MRELLLWLVAALPRPQGHAPADGELPRLLLEDVRAWTGASELPASEDIRALMAEVERLDAGAARELLRELGSLGHRLGREGRKEEARALVHWVGVRARASGDLATQAWSLDWLAQEAWVDGGLEPAVEWLERAAEVEELRGAPLERTRCLADVARIRLIQGRFEEAQRSIARAGEVARAAGSEAALRAVAEVHGSLLFELGRHREALELCLASTEPQGEIPHDETQVRLDILAADVLADVGRLETAAAYARRAHEIALDPRVLRTAPLLHLEAKLALGLLLGDLGASDEAMALLDAAAAEHERLGDARGAGWAAKNRGFVRFASGRHAEALSDFERAWQTGRELGVPFLEGFGALGVAETLVYGTPAAALDEVRVQGALSTAQRLAGELREHTLEWRCAALRGHVLLVRGELAAALDELRRSVALIERWRRRLRTGGLVEHALRQRSDPYRDAALAAARLGRMQEALAFAALLQARVLDELSARSDGPLPPPGSPAVEALRERIARLEHGLRRADADEGARAEERLALQRSEDELDAALLAEELASGRALAAPSERLPLEPLGRALTEEGFDAALVYLVCAEETLAFRIAAGAPARVTGRRLPIGRERLRSCIERLRGPIERLAAGELDLAHLGFDVEAARELEDALVRPLDLRAGTRLALVTDGVLGALPFELLVTGGELGPFDSSRPFEHLRGLRFLGDEHAFVSFGSLARVRGVPEARAGEAVIVLAPVALGLPRAVEEGRSIAQVLGGARIVREATPEDVARETRGARLVHFAVHGRMDPERPARGHLVLGGPDGGASARLESWQAAELELDGALVVLSACHSGRGEWRDGAGLAGLTRGFLLAGARELVASHWAVEDRATARFMELFYAELARGSPASEALRTARVALRGGTDPRGFALAHPAFWAAWTLQR
jgi:tetratricopeptide (TPR) repeat protein